MNNIDTAKKVINLEIKALEELSRSVGNEFSDAVDLISEVKKSGGRVIITGMGKSGHIGIKIAATLASTGTIAYFVHPAEASHGDLGMIARGDIIIAISNSGESIELNDIINYSLRFNVKLIGITKNPESTLGKASKIVLRLPNVPEACPMGLAPTSSTTSSLVIGDAIAVCLLEKMNFDAGDFKTFHPGGKLGKKIILAKDIMKTDIPVTSSNITVKYAIEIMEKYKRGCIGVVNDGKICGMLTDGDIRRNSDKDFSKSYVYDIMTKNPLTITEQTPVSNIISSFEAKNISSVFVCHDGNVVGHVHFLDILKAGII